MNYYKPRQRESDGRFDYTCQNDGAIWPVGYCRPWMEWPADIKAASPRADAKHQATKHKHHEDGHATPEEASECYKQYLLDHTLRLDRESSQSARKCEVCQEWTTKSASVDYYHVFHLCDEHRTREEVEKRFAPPGEIWSS